MPTILFIAAVSAAFAADPESLFQKTILPALQRDCTGCHGSGQSLSKLDLSTRAAALKGGTRGPAITPRDAANSLLYKAISGQTPFLMPPGKPLAESTIAAFKEWIDGGAPYADASPKQTWGKYKPEDLWAFQPLQKSTRGTLDSFFPPQPAANRRTLIRRATFDLTGLPPSPEQVEAFVNDNSPGAYAKLVETLLASPRYGERWGRHWLDIVRYADTSGYSNDFERPNAWRYRDYVIRSFNQDKPYTQFIREQIAGDELDPDNAEYRIATGFLRSGPWEHTGMSVEAVTRQMFLDDVTNSVGVTFLAMTLGCARCHDHKFDPIPTRDYYRVQAIFATTEFARPPAPFLASENTRDIPESKAHLEAIVARNQASMKAFRDAHKDAVTGESEELKLYNKHAQLFKESLDRFEPKAFAVSSGPMDGYTDGGPNLRYPKLEAYQPPDVHILPGGNVQSPSTKVEPGLLSILSQQPIPNTVSGRRLALANWIASAENPLTARVMANRIWQYHFGAGIAGDTNNFGKMGKKPSNPELLDWLAASFIEQGWSMKSMHRLIMLSNAYQSAAMSPRRLEAEALRDSILAVSGELSLEAGGPGVFPQINDDAARQPRHAMGSLQPAYYPSAKKSQRNRRTVYTFQQRSLIDPMIEVFNGPSLDLSCERRESSTVPTQAFALFNSQFVHDMALAMAVRLEREASTDGARIDRAFQLAYGRKPEANERSIALAHLARQIRYHEKTPAPPKPEKRPIIHTITSELTGEQSVFVQPGDPVAMEENLHPSEVKAHTRALADLALVLLNSNEFLYVY